MGIWNVDFDIAAFIICLIIVAINATNSHLKTWQNKTFSKLLLCSFVSCITDVIIVYTTVNWRTHLVVPNIILNAVHLCFFNTIPMLYLLFIVTMVIDYSDFNRKWKAVVFIPYIITVLLIPPAAITKILYGFDSQGVYHRQLCSTLLYFIAFYYIITSLVITVRYRSRLSFSQQAVAITYNVISYVTIGIQFLFPQYLLAQFEIAVCMVFIFLALQNPFDQKDYLSEAFNLKAFYTIVPEFISFKRPFSIITIKLANLNSVNEMFGNDTGNQIIMQFGSFLSRKFGHEAYAFHIRGSLFSVTVTDRKRATVIASEISEYCSHPLYINHVKIETTGCICCLSYPEDFQDFPGMNSLTSYVVAKNSNTGAVPVISGSPEILKEKARDAAVGQAVTDAIQNKSFDVYFQPVRCVENGLFESAEALARLHTDALGFIPPDEFIPKAETSGQIIKLGDIVLEKTCRCIREYGLAQKGIRNIKVNLSAIQCMQDGLAQRMIDIIDSYQIPHELISFEITESVAVESDRNRTFFSNIEKLRKAGFIFLLDDYGTGYSNISKLITYQFGVVKMDKSIVWAAEKNEAAYISLKYTTRMIKELNMQVLAEGVETDSQADMLKELGIDYFQGYLYSKPLSEQNFISFLEQHNA